MTPKSVGAITFTLTVDGTQKPVQIAPALTTEIKDANGNIVLDIKRYVKYGLWYSEFLFYFLNFFLRYKDNVYYVYFVQEGLLILFDGENIEISPSQILKARACGLCGDLDHENTADLKVRRSIFC